MALADRDLVDADGPRSWLAHARKLCTQAPLLQVLDRGPVKRQLLGHVLHSAARTAPAHVGGKAPRVMRVVGEEGKPLALHLSAASAIDAPHLELERDTRVPVGQIACLTNRAVVPPPMHRPTRRAHRFFERRTSVMTRARGSPPRPRICSSGRKLANRYASSKRLRRGERAIGQSSRFLEHVQTEFCQIL